MEIHTEWFSYTPEEIMGARKIMAQPEIRRQRLYGIITLGVLVLIAAPLAILYAVVARFMPDDAARIWGVFHESWRQWAWLIALPAGSILGRYVDLILWPGRVRRSFKTDANQYTNIRAVFGDELVQLSWPQAESRFEWPFYSSVKESRNFFLLLYGSQYTTVPKRALAAEDIPQLAALLRQRIATYSQRG